jgi:FolB domain-containing protein
LIFGHWLSKVGFESAKILTIEKSQAGDSIHLEQLEVFARVGVPEEERAAPQRLTFNITVWPLKSGAELHDEISRAVNYAAVCAETKKFVSARRDRLIETLVDALAMHLLQRFEIQKVAIEVRKFVLPEVEYVSVTVTRERPA